MVTGKKSSLVGGETLSHGFILQEHMDGKVPEKWSHKRVYHNVGLWSGIALDNGS